MGKEIMLCFMAKLTQALEAHQVLMVRLFVKLPDFVAVHPALTLADLAVVASPAINVASNAVPLATRQQVSQAGTP